MLIGEMFEDFDDIVNKNILKSTNLATCYVKSEAIKAFTIHN